MTVAARGYGFTASAVCSVSDTPATLLVCINRASSSFPAFENDEKATLLYCMRRYLND
ncbi:flavin reductase (DIM6/NTAB) family NADH-FMN oxidoreductase RutF [Pseudochelatococcus lubricantis]|uniref:Flavin reductase (DIM6/NTAB) family NADH-FMN oxidoreductase RutF n=1 Tax=Pseudochelatococcus lubricantis TaxID=1538102 RepID=A0ABX0V4X7_9HYPH|nr:flavin reductase (DIM6/NTAB) family NADH-FMN oxidoreductase RutF [Pseudochelatococcus lubricantis]